MKNIQFIVTIADAAILAADIFIGMHMIKRWEGWE